MKKLVIVILSILLVYSNFVFANKAAGKDKNEDKTVEAAQAAIVEFNTNQQKVGYALGMDLGKNLKRQELDIDFDMFLLGIQTAYTGKQGLLTDTQIREILVNFQSELIAKRQADFQKKAEENKVKGEEYLKANAQKDGVIKLENGIQYKIIKSGSGEKPSVSDRVLVHYKGSTIDGKVFDNSYERDEPLDISVDGVIAGWQEILQIMPVGSKWEVVIPSDLGYGIAGAQPIIGPNETLIFEIELIEIIKQKTE